METIKKNKMVHWAEETADASAISFKLGDIFGHENVIFDEMRENDVSDEGLASILDDVNEDHSDLRQTTETKMPVAEDKAPHQVHFPELTNKDLDDLVIHAKIKHTSKQHGV